MRRASEQILLFGDLYLCPVAVLGLAALTLVQCDMVAIGQWAAAFLVGGVLWTFIEYAVHRSVCPVPASSKRCMTLITRNRLA